MSNCNTIMAVLSVVSVS